MEPKIVVFKNEKGEDFSLSVFQPPCTTICIDGHDAPLPVLFCVHGAGMSSASFYRLARQLVSERSDEAGHMAEPAESTSLPTAPHDNAASSSGMLPPHLPSASHGLARPPAPLPLAARSSQRGHEATAYPPSLTVNTLDAPIGDHIGMCVVAYDLRCHGDSTFAGGEESLTLDVLVEDFKAILKYAKSSLFPGHQFFVLGHSVGGSIVSHGLKDDKDALANVGGAVLVDAVEGTAKLSLAHMGDFLARRPVTFHTIKQAEQWFLKSGGMRTPAGAAVTVPPLLKQTADGAYTWKTDLNRTASVWDTWFDGIDQAFVSLPMSKMLCLANAERLDTAMTVAQMQGKFQFEVIGNDCGHYVMDDATATLAAKIQRFVKRILVLTQKLNNQVKPSAPLHFNNTTIPPKRMT